MPRSRPWPRPCAAACRPTAVTVWHRGARDDGLPGRSGAADAGSARRRSASLGRAADAARLAPLPARARGRAAGPARGPVRRRRRGRLRGADRSSPTSWRRISPRSSSRRTSPARWRRSRARSRSSGASPASSSTACRSASTSSTATTASRSGTASGRPAPRASGATTWSAGRSSTCSPGSRAAQLRAEFDRVFETGEIQQTEQEVHAGRGAALLPAQQDPHAARRRRDHPRHHHRRGRDRVAPRSRARSSRARSSRRSASSPPASCTRSTIRSPPSAPAWRPSRAGCRAGAADAAPGRRSISRSSTRRSSAAPGSSTGCSTSAGPKATRKAAGVAQRPGGGDASSCSSTTSASSGSQVDARARARACPPTVGNAEQLIQVLMALMLNALDAMEQGGQLTVRTGAEPGARRTRSWSRWRTPAWGFPRARADQDLRAVLHHQAAGTRHRPRTLDLLRHRRGAPRPDRGGQRSPGAAPPSGVLPAGARA